MSGPVFDLLLVAWPGGFPGPAGLDSPYGCFRITRCEAREAMAATLQEQRADVVLVGANADDCAALAAWSGLGDVAGQAALVLVTEAPPPSEVVLQLVAAGLQDLLVAPDAATLARSLRLAIERHARERAARRAASTDLLTGLPNQGQLVEHMSQLLALRERAPAPMVVIVLRLEGLGTAEAEFGREATNSLRRKLAVRLRAATRAGDVIASIAHDRFAVLLPHVHSADDGARVADKLIAALHVPIGLAGRQVHIGAAAGIAKYPDDGREPATLLGVAGDMAALVPAKVGADAPDDRNPRPEAANDG